MNNCKICGNMVFAKEKESGICDTCIIYLQKLIKHYSKESYEYFSKFDMDNVPEKIRMQIYSYSDFFRFARISEEERYREYEKMKEESFERRKAKICFESSVSFLTNVGFNFTYEDICKYTEDGTISWRISFKDCYKRGGLQLVYYSDVMAVLVIKGVGTKIESGYIRYNKDKQESISPQRISKLLKIIGKVNPDIYGKKVLEQIGNQYLEKSFIDMRKLQSTDTSKIIELKKRIDEYWQVEKFYSNEEIRELLKKEEHRKYWAQYYADQRELKELIRTQYHELSPSGCSGGSFSPR